MRFQILTLTKDRHGTQIDPKGVRVENFLRNPIFLWNHQRSDPEDIIGRVEKLEVTETAIFAEVAFRDAPKAQDILSLYRDGFLHMVSIGFDPQSTTVSDGNRITSWELWEISATPIGSNPDALAIRRLLSIAMDKKACLQKLGLAEDAAKEAIGAALMEYLKSTTDTPDIRAQVCACVDEMTGDGETPQGGADSSAELDGTRAALVASRAENAALRKRINDLQVATKSQDSKSWVAQQIKDQRWPEGSRSVLETLHRKSPQAATAAVAQFAPGEFPAHLQLVTEAGAPIGTRAAPSAKTQLAQADGVDAAKIKADKDAIMAQSNRIAERGN